MAYPRDRACPSSHPVPLPAITINVSWVLTPGLDVRTLRLSSDSYSRGLPGGFSAHADWFDAWEPEIRDAFVTNCINPGRDCHAHLLGDGRQIRD